MSEPTNVNDMTIPNADQNVANSVAQGVSTVQSIIAWGARNAFWLLPVGVLGYFAFTKSHVIAGQYAKTRAAMKTNPRGGVPHRNCGHGRGQRR